MEHKPIYLDGIDVSGCEFYVHYDYGRFSHGCSLHKDMFGLPVYCDIADCCEDCYFKQLARKTQECEELKERLERTEEDLKYQCVDCMNIKSDRYRKALEEIEGLVKNFCKDCDDYEDCNWEKEGCYYSLIPNLKDIINKAKGEIMEIT